MRAKVVLALVGLAFCAGALVTARLTQPAPNRRVAEGQAGAVGTAGKQGGDRAVETSPGGTPASSSERPVTGAAAVAALKARDLEVPIEGADVAKWKGSFYEEHSGHRHEAVDVLAPRNTPIHAVDAGVIAKLFVSKAGGLTVYERDPGNQFMYYYAHLERYGDVHEGERITRGQVIGYVGTSGNAPQDTPHLHFAIFVLDDPAKWWEGTAIDPYEIYEGR